MITNKKSDEQDLVSVIIPCFNCGKYLHKTVQSILTQSYSNIECLIIDDGSTDNSKAVCTEIMNQDERVRYLYKKNRGVASARNYGIQNAKGVWIQQLDSDDLLHKDKIKRHLEQLKNYDASRDIIFYTDWDIIWLEKNEKIRQGNTIVVGEKTNAELLEQLIKWQFLPNSPLSNNTLFFKKDIFRHKTYDEQLGAFEDFELFVDLLLRDIMFIYTPIVGMSYLQHSTNMTRDKSVMISNYVQYLYAINKKDRILVKQCQTIGMLLLEMLYRKDKKRYHELTQLIDDTSVPVYFLDKRFNFRNTHILRLIFVVRSILPVITVHTIYKNTFRFIMRAYGFTKRRILR